MRPTRNLREIRSNPSPLAYVKKRKSPTAFSLFFKMYNNILKEEFPTSTPQEIMKKAGERWRASTPSLKNLFIMYASERQKMQNYDSAHPPPSFVNVFDTNKKEEEEGNLKDCHHPVDVDACFDLYVRPDSYIP